MSDPSIYSSLFYPHTHCDHASGKIQAALEEKERPGQGWLALLIRERIKVRGIHQIQVIDETARRWA